MKKLIRKLLKKDELVCGISLLSGGFLGIGFVKIVSILSSTDLSDPSTLPIGVFCLILGMFLSFPLSQLLWHLDSKWDEYEEKKRVRESQVFDEILHSLEPIPVKDTSTSKAKNSPHPSCPYVTAFHEKQKEIKTLVSVIKNERNLSTDEHHLLHDVYIDTLDKTIVCFNKLSQEERQEEFSSLMTLANETEANVSRFLANTRKETRQSYEKQKRLLYMRNRQY